MAAIASRLPIYFLLSIIFAGSLGARMAQTKESIDPAAAWRAQGFRQYLSGNRDEALASYQKAVDTALHEFGPDSSYAGELYYEMGALALDAGKPHTAEIYLQKAVQQNPNSIMARVRYSEALQLRGKGDAALQQLQMALARHHDSAEAREALIVWLQNKGNTPRAIQESYILSQSVARIAPPRVPQPVRSVIAATPPPPPAPAVVAAIAPPLPEKRAAIKSVLIKPKSTIEKKAQEKQEASKHPVKEPAHAKPIKPKAEPKPKHGGEKKAEPVTAPVQELRAQAAPALVTSAKALPKAKTKTPDAKKSDADEVQAPEPAPKKEEPKPKEEKPKQQAPQQWFQPPVVNMMPKEMGKPKKGSFVPPPPPMVPAFPGAMPYQYAPPPQQPPPKVEKPKVKEKPKEAAPPAETKAGEDPDFILEWAGKKKK